MKQRKLRIGIDIIQYTGKNGNVLREWSRGIITESPVLEPTKDNISGKYVQIRTLNGKIITAIIGVWIAKNKFGDYIVCNKPDTYEIIGEDDKLCEV